MTTGVSGFYDDFAPHYDLFFEDWEASMNRQAAAIASILEREGRATGTAVLECACGIGT
jgi:ubiquinone/menaquinone biosynthesis C-methylase UbiE